MCDRRVIESTYIVTITFHCILTALCRAICKYITNVIKYPTDERLVTVKHFNHPLIVDQLLAQNVTFVEDFDINFSFNFDFDFNFNFNFSFDFNFNFNFNLILILI